MLHVEIARNKILHSIGHVGLHFCATTNTNLCKKEKKLLTPELTPPFKYFEVKCSAQSTPIKLSYITDTIFVENH